LALIGSVEADAADDFRREVRDARDLDVGALGERVADAERAVIGNADNVAGHRFVGQLAVVAEKEHRVGDADVLAGAHVAQLHAALERARRQAEERDAVAMVGVHVGLHLEHEAGDLRLAGIDRRRLGRLRPRLGRPGAERREQFGTEMVFSAEPKITGVRWPAR
jgi:hypothetical protein